PASAAWGYLTGQEVTDDGGWTLGLADSRLILDAHLDENRVRGRERPAQRPLELGATADPHGFDALSACQGAEIEMRQVRARQRREAEVRCEFIERAIAAVVDDHEGDGQRELRGTP